MPVVATLSYLFWAGESINWLIGLWTLLTIIVFHAAGNTWSDYFDFKKGVDREDTVGGTSITSGEFQACEIKKLATWLLVVAVASGLALAYCTGLPTLYFGLAGCVLTLLYPMLKYHALGDLDIFLTYSVLPILGTSYVATGSIVAKSLWLVLPIGLITVGILHINNARDIEHDKRAGIKTFAMLMGKRASVYIYLAELIIPFLCIVAGILCRAMPAGAVAVLITLKPAIDNCRAMLKLPTEGMKAVTGVDENTAKLQLAFSMTFSVVCIVSALLDSLL
ncbi:MAG: prenyltransferase [Bacteroidaceae bacterium]|nr:prenyltransferase [Bacteroidaceae bacterium]